jgi:hypothetical protein
LLLQPTRWSARLSATLDLMITTAPRTDRWTAVTLLAMAAFLPAGVLFLYLFTTEPVDLRHRLEVAMEPDGGGRMKFVLLAVGAAVSAIAAAAIAMSRRRVILRTALACAATLTLSYAVTGMWLFMFVSALPLWWAYKVAA